MPSLEVMQPTLDLLPDAVFGVDCRTGIIRAVNRAACVALGYTSAELCGVSLNAIAPACDVAALPERLDDTATVRTTHRKKDGGTDAVEWRIARRRAGGNELWLIVAREVADEQGSSTSVESYGLGLPGHDPLTGLPDRRLFQRRLDRALQQDGPLAVCFIDIDGFKAVNDRFGHLAGDRVLCEIARRLVGCVRPGDVVARFGGDEFTVFLDGVRSESDAGCAAQRILDRLQSPATIDEHRVTLAASVGVVVGPGDCHRAEELLHRADQAMYRAKSFGGGRWAL
jgi:diguanylate cyclase (GGDEF)-like protein/PAS domain S-box-containing protein